jgi:internalin A
LRELQSLDLSGCQQLSDVSVLSGLSALQSLDLSWCGQLSDVSVLSGLSALQSLDLRRCGQLSDVSVLSGLSALQSLNLSGCGQLSDVSALSGLSALQSLNLSGCGQLSDVSALSGLSELQNLDLRGCSGLSLSRKDVEAFVTGMPRLHMLCLPTCQGIPAEFDTTDLNFLPTLVNWLDDLAESGPLIHDEIKLLVLGNGRAGKTQVVRRLCGASFDPSVASTHGIEVGHFQVLAADEAEQQPAIHARVWDFGGQDVYLGTHRLFLDDRAVYLLVWSNPTENNDWVQDGSLRVQNRPLGYWLAYIRSLAGPNAPVIVLQTQCDREREVREAPIPTQHGFKRLRTTAGSAQRADGLERLLPELRAAVRYQRERMSDVELPASWLRVRDQLRQLKTQGHKVQTLDAYRALCQQAPAVLAPDTLLNYLHTCGEVFWRQGVFDARLVLDQAWALEGVYALMHRGSVMPFLRRHHGHFSREDLNDLLWDGQFTPAEQALFIELMKQCGVCFEVAPGRYVAPDCLPQREDVATQGRKEWRGLEAEAHLRLRYDFLHDGTMRGLLSALGEKAGPDAVYWRYGCCVEDGQRGVGLRVNCVLEPVADGSGQPGYIDLETRGPDALELLAHLQASMQKSDWGGHEPEPIWIKGGKSEMNPALSQQPEPPTQRPDASQQPFEQVPRSQPARAPERPCVYVSYAWGGDSDRLVDALQAQMPAEVDFRRDRTAMQTGDSIRRFELEIGRAPHVVVVLSAKYLKSVDCVRELTLLWQQSQGEGNDFAERIIPVVLDDAGITTQRQRIAHLRHWKDEKEALERDAAELGMAHAGQTTVRELQDIGAFLSYLVDSLTWLADRVMPRGFARLEGENFTPVLDLLHRRLGLPQA